VLLGVCGKISTHQIKLSGGSGSCSVGRAHHQDAVVVGAAHPTPISLNLMAVGAGGEGEAHAIFSPSPQPSPIKGEGVLAQCG